MLKEKGDLNEEITIKVTRRDVLLILLCIDMTRKHTKGGTLLYDLECLLETSSRLPGRNVHSSGGRG